MTEMNGSLSATGSTASTNLLVSAAEMRETRQSPARRRRGWSMDCSLFRRQAVAIVAGLLALAVRGQQLHQHAPHHEPWLVGRHVALDTGMHVERHVGIGAFQDRAVFFGHAPIEG